MKKTITSFVFLFLICTLSAKAQDSLAANRGFDRITIGFGLGLDHGGFGFNFTAYPQKNIGIFGGFGFALAGFGYNTGVKLRFRAKKHFSPYLLGMYGYNAAIFVSNDPSYNKIFYGPSMGAGFEFSNHKPKGGFLVFAILVPFRSPDVNNYISTLENTNGVSFNNTLTPVTFSLGYHIAIW